MFSRILIKLIDQAIIPALLLVFVKVVSTVVLLNYLRIPIISQSTFFTLYFSNYADFLLVNSYSTFLMFLVVFIGGFFFLIKSRIFHDTHVTPTVAAKMFSLKLGGFIQTSFDIYSEGTIWLSYSYLMTVVLGLYFYFKLVYGWVFVLSLILSVFLTLILVLDVEKEVKGVEHE